MTTPAVAARGLGKRYGRKWALSDCTLTIPASHVVGLVGPNGAGKTTLIGLLTGMLGPTTGRIEVLGAAAPNSPEQLARIGYVAQGTPIYAGLSVADHLRFGAHANPGWDGALAARRIQDLGLDLRQKAGKLSGGQRAQLALTLGLAKRPELLILDEPIASLDPLARHEFLQNLMAATAEHELSIIMSSHLIADLERVCDYLVVLAGSRVVLDGPVEELLACHHLVTGRRREATFLPPGGQVITQSHTDRQSTFLVRSTAPVIDATFSADPVDLEQLVLAYMGGAARTSPALEAQR
jgi:ABC-2 type transport system ATP-binding protein